MGYEILKQEQIFWYACILGVILGVLYDMFRIVRLTFKWSNLQIFIQDVFYFIICGISTFLFLLVFNNGVVRSYVLCGELIGWTIYYITLGEIVYRFSNNIIRFIKKIVRQILLVILNPFRLMFKRIKCKFYNKKIKNNKM